MRKKRPNRVTPSRKILNLFRRTPEARPILASVTLLRHVPVGDAPLLGSVHHHPALDHALCHPFRRISRHVFQPKGVAAMTAHRLEISASGAKTLDIGAADRVQALRIPPTCPQFPL